MALVHLLVRIVRERQAMQVRRMGSLFDASTRHSFGAALATGATVTVPSVAAEEIHEISRYVTSPEGAAHLARVRATLDASTETQLPRERMAIGWGGVGGTGAGIVFSELSDTIRQAGMGASIGVTVGCAMLGCAFGALIGTGSVSEISFDPIKGLFAIKAARGTG